MDSQPQQRLPAMAERIERLLDWARRLWLPPRRAALVGGVAGLLVGLVIAVNMRMRAVFTEPYQDVTAGAAIVAIWICIGVVSGLTVLSPDDPGG